MTDLLLLSLEEKQFTEILHLYYPKGRLCSLLEGQSLADNATEFQMVTNRLYRQWLRESIQRRVCLVCTSELLRIYRGIYGAT